MVASIAQQKERIRLYLIKQLVETPETRDLALKKEWIVSYLTTELWDEVAIDRHSLGFCGWLQCSKPVAPKRALAKFTAFLLNDDHDLHKDILDCICSPECLHNFMAVRVKLSQTASWKAPPASLVEAYMLSQGIKVKQPKSKLIQDITEIQPPTCLKPPRVPKNIPQTTMFHYTETAISGENLDQHRACKPVRKRNKSRQTDDMDLDNDTNSRPNPKSILRNNPGQSPSRSGSNPPALSRLFTSSDSDDGCLPFRKITFDPVIKYDDDDESADGFSYADGFSHYYEEYEPPILDCWLETLSILMTWSRRQTTNFLLQGNSDNILESEKNTSSVDDTADEEIPIYKAKIDREHFLSILNKKLRSMASKIMIPIEIRDEIAKFANTLEVDKVI